MQLDDLCLYEIISDLASQTTQRHHVKSSTLVLIVRRLFLGQTGERMNLIVYASSWQTAII